MAFVMLAMASCRPLDGVYKNLDANPTPQTIAISLSTTDYQSLPSSVYAYASHAFKSNDDAKLYIPTILNTYYGNSAEGSVAAVTFSYGTSVPLVADSLYAHVAYTLATTDYTFPGNSYADLSASGIINWLNYRYPSPANNQLAVLTYVYYESGATASAGTTVTDSFLYTGGVWTKIYTVSPAQYTLVNRGVNFYFTATDLANLPSYFNQFLLNDPTVMATAKVGDIKYVSYKYTATYQKVLPLTYNGTNWINNASLNFLKLNGTWVPDPTVYITEPDAPGADYTYLATTTIGTASGRSNLAQYGDFNIQSTSTYYWSDADITAAFAAILLHKFPSAPIGVPYKITYYVYSGSTSTASKTYKFNGTAFVIPPQ